METPQHNIAGWFEIPVLDMDRAIRFYEAVFQLNLQRETLEGLDMAWFPWNMEGQGAPGSLVCHPEFYQPSSQGTLLYRTATSGDAAVEMGRVEDAGGKVIIPKKLISEDYGYMGVFIDTEGNRIAVHSRA